MHNVIWLLGVGVLLWFIADGIVRIIAASKGRASNRRIEELESDLAEMDLDIEETRRRLEVLEKIVLDDQAGSVDGAASDK